MTIKQIANIIYTPGTVSQHRIITVKRYNDGHQVWKGKAIDMLDDMEFCGINMNYEVVEILVDFSNDNNFTNDDTPFYNRDKIIRVI